MLLIIFFRLLIIFTTIGLVFRKSDLRPLKTHKNCGGSKKKSIFLLQICRLYVYPYVRRHKLMSKDILITVFTGLRKTFLRQAQRILPTEEDAEDVVHDVFIKYMQASPSFADDDHERAWLIRVTVNRCRDLLRRRAIRRYVGFDEIEEIPAEEEPYEGQGVVAMVSALPEKYRSVMVLHYLEGYSVEECANILELSVSAIKMRLSRGREMLKKTIEKEG